MTGAGAGAGVDAAADAGGDHGTPGEGAVPGPVWISDIEWTQAAAPRQPRSPARSAAVLAVPPSVPVVPAMRPSRAPRPRGARVGSVLVRADPRGGEADDVVHDLREREVVLIGAMGRARQPAHLDDVHE